MNTELVNSNDMILSCKKVLNRAVCHDTFIHYPIHGDNKPILTKDLHDDDIITVSHNLEIDSSHFLYPLDNHYDIIFVLRKYMVFEKVKESGGFKSKDRFSIKFNGRYESFISEEEFTDLYGLIIEVDTKLKMDKEEFNLNMDRLAFEKVKNLFNMEKDDRIKFSQFALYHKPTKSYVFSSDEAGEHFGGDEPCLIPTNDWECYFDSNGFIFIENGDKDRYPIDEFEIHEFVCRIKRVFGWNYKELKNYELEEKEEE